MVMVGLCVRGIFVTFSGDVAVLDWMSHHDLISFWR